MNEKGRPFLPVNSQMRSIAAFISFLLPSNVSLRVMLFDFSSEYYIGKKFSVTYLAETSSKYSKSLVIFHNQFLRNFCNLLVNLSWGFFLAHLSQILSSSLLSWLIAYCKSRRSCLRKYQLDIWQDHRFNLKELKDKKAKDFKLQVSIVF